MNILTFSSKDWLFFFNEQLRQLPLFPFIWDSVKGNGLGENVAHVLWIRAYQFITSWVLHNILHLNWLGIEVLIFFAPFIILSLFSSYYLTRSWIGSLIYTTNTYILMIVGGGQMGVALAYALAPLVLGLFINYSRVNELTSPRVNPNSLINNSLIKNKLIPGLVLGVQIMWDPRIALITMMAVLGYHLFIFKFSSLKSLITSFLIGSFLNFFWILPLLKTGSAGLGSLGEAYTATGMVEFLSFADFSNTISLLHPNWPENIFGKTYFMRPEFLILPILAFSSLLFINYSITNYELRIKKNVLFRQKQTCLFFALLGIVGAFLAKGSKPPFGGIYLWLFRYFPGMSMFRDPTKFYILVALSYSVLIPFSVGQIYLYLRKKFNN